MLAMYDARHDYDRVGQFMTTDVFSLHVDEVIDLAASVMAWRKIRHIPVEDDDRRLVGIVTEHDFMAVAGHLLDEAYAARRIRHAT